MPLHSNKGKKLKKLGKKVNTPLRSDKEVRSQGKPLLPKLERYMGNLENHYLSDQKPQTETSMETSSGYKNLDYNDKLLKARCGQL